MKKIMILSAGLINIFNLQAELKQQGVLSHAEFQKKFTKAPPSIDAQVLERRLSALKFAYDQRQIPERESISPFYPQTPSSFYDSSRNHSLRAPGVSYVPKVDLQFTPYSRFDGVLPFYGQSFPNAGSFGVGPSQIATFSYFAVRSFDKAGNRDNVLDVSGAQFFSPVGTALPVDFLADVIAQFDHWSQRWFVVSNTNQPLGNPNPGFLYIAFSDGPLISIKTKWTYFSFNVAQIPPAVARPALLADYPKMGIDQKAIYIGFNEFDNLDPLYQDSSIVVLPKAELLNGTPIINAFRNLLTQYGTLWPAGVNNFDSNPSLGYAVSGNLFTSSDINLFKIANPETSTPSLTVEFLPINTIQVFLALTGQGAPQKGNLYGNNSLLEFIGAIVGSSNIRNNNLYMAFDAAVDSTGNTNTPLADREGILWFQYNVSNPLTSTLVQSGVIFDSAAVNPLWFIWAGSNVNKNGEFVVSSSVTGQDSFVNMMVAGRKASDALGSISDPTFVTNSQAPLNMGPNLVFQFGQQRFGEQTAIAVDPTDDLTMWAAAEWVAAQDNWATQIVKLLPQ